MVRGVSPESQRTEYKSSWQEEYLEWICGYANASGGRLYIGVNDDGYVVGLQDTRYLLDELPNRVVSTMGIVVDVEHRVAECQGVNLKYAIVPDDIAAKPANLCVRGILKKEALAEIDSAPENTQDVSSAVRILFDSAPGFVKQLRQSEEHRKKVFRDLGEWESNHSVHIWPDGSLGYVCITVRPYPYGISFRGHYYQRSGGTTREMVGLELSSFLLDRAGLHWDGRPVQSLSVRDLDSAAIDAYRKKAVEKGRHAEADVAVSDDQVISDLKLFDERQVGGGSLMNAAVLMFHSDPERFVTGASVKIAYYAPEGAYGANKSDDIIYQDEIHGPLILQADKVVDLVYTKYLKALTSYEGIQRVETFMAPREAFREIILNAINHKYYESGNPIQVSVYDDRIVVFNQGRWPEDIDLADVYTRKHSSYPHNPNLSKVFFNAGEIEAYGGGFAKIKIECDRYGAPYPELRVTPNGVTVEVKACDLYMKLLRYGRYWKTYPEFKLQTTDLLVDENGACLVDEDGVAFALTTVEDLAPAVVASVDRMGDILARELTDGEKKRMTPIYDYLKENDVIDARIAMRVTGKSSSTVNRYLQRLVGLDVLVPVGGSKNTAYRRV